MKLLALFAAVLLAVNAHTDKDQWVAFKQTHGKTYKSLLEERTRFGIFQNNLRTIEEHNARYEQGQETYYKAITRFADMTLEEFRQMLNLQIDNRPHLDATRHVFPENLELPDEIDWVKKGAVLDIKDQGKCGCCWAFSATGSLEGQNAILNNVKIPLSEEQLLDCSWKYGNSDCLRGGYMTNAFKYILDYGIEAESTYPYRGDQWNYRCTYDETKTILNIKGFEVLAESEEELKKAVGSIGPISIGVAAEVLHNYGRGIVNACTGELNHGVLAVGYGTENGIKYWKVKNSWGPSFGEEGYFRLERDAGNLCNVSSLASYPIL